VRVPHAGLHRRCAARAQVVHARRSVANLAFTTEPTLAPTTEDRREPHSVVSTLKSVGEKVGEVGGSLIGAAGEMGGSSMPLLVMDAFKDSHSLSMVIHNLEATEEGDGKDALSDALSSLAAALPTGSEEVRAGSKRAGFDATKELEMGMSVAGAVRACAGLKQLDEIEEAIVRVVSLAELEV
jgi:hypothetical protein